MAVNVEGSRRSITVDVEVRGTPEQVWHAVATGPGISAWFFPSEVDERAGGSILCRFGPGMEANATILDWEPPRRLTAKEAGWVPDGPTLYTEWLVENGHVRVTHWIDEESDRYDAMLLDVQEGWVGFFHLLRLYLAHFAGEPAASFCLMGGGEATVGETWQKLQPFPAVGTVERHGQDDDHLEMLVRFDNPMPGLAVLWITRSGESVSTMASLYLYGEGAAETAARAEPAWREWLQPYLGA